MPRNKVIYGDEVLIDLTGDTVQPETLGLGVTAHDAAGNPITGTMTGGKPEQTKTVTPKASAQTVTPDSGYTLSSVTVNAVPTQTKTATPSAASQDVTPDSGKFLSKVTVSGDSNLVAGNIKSGVSIFGVAGSFEGSGGGGSGGNVETCTVTVNLSGAGSFVFRIASVSDGVYCETERYSGNFTIENVVCGSAVTMLYAQSYGCDVTTNNIDLVQEYYDQPLGFVGRLLVFRAPTAKGSIGTISIVDED